MNFGLLNKKLMEQRNGSDTSCELCKKKMGSKEAVYSKDDKDVCRKCYYGKTEGSRPEFYIVRKKDGKVVSKAYKSASDADKDLNKGDPEYNTKNYQVIDGRYLNPGAFGGKNEAKSPPKSVKIRKDSDGQWRPKFDKEVYINFQDYTREGLIKKIKGFYPDISIEESSLDEDSEKPVDSLKKGDIVYVGTKEKEIYSVFKSGGKVHVTFKDGKKISYPSGSTIVSESEKIMEPGFVKTPEDEKKWKRAKEIARKQNPDDFWALANHIYHSIKKGKSESSWTESFQADLSEAQKGKTVTFQYKVAGTDNTYMGTVTKVDPDGTIHLKDVNVYLSSGGTTNRTKAPSMKINPKWKGWKLVQDGISEAVDPPVIAQMRNIVKKGSHGKVNGKPLDSSSASAVVQVFDKLNPANQKKFLSMSIGKMVDSAFKILHKAGSKGQLGKY